MKYKKGDRVQVRSDLKHLDWIGGYIIIPQMLNYKDNIVTINEVFENCYKIKEDNGSYRWTDGMFEELAFPAHYNIGDKVRIKENLISDKEYNNVYCNDISNHAGKIYTIKSISQSVNNFPIYSVEEFDWMHLTEPMFDLVNKGYMVEAPTDNFDAFQININKHKSIIFE